MQHAEIKFMSIANIEFQSTKGGKKKLESQIEELIFGSTTSSFVRVT